MYLEIRTFIQWYYIIIYIYIYIYIYTGGTEPVRLELLICARTQTRKASETPNKGKERSGDRAALAARLHYKVGYYRKPAYHGSAREKVGRV